MSLNTGHKKLIHAMIDYLIDFPADEKKLGATIDDLINAFPIDEDHRTPPENNEFADLYKFIVTPTSTLLHLEKDNPDVYIHEVQTYILDYIYEQLVESLNLIEKTKTNDTNSNSKKIKKEKPDDKRDEDKLDHEGLKAIMEDYFDELKLIFVEKDHTKKFVTELPPDNSTLPWINVHTDGETLTFSLEINYTVQGVYINSSHTIGNLEFPQKIFLAYVPPNDGRNNFEYRYLYSLIDIARDVAINHARKSILKYFFDNHYYDQNLHTDLHYNVNLGKLLINQFFIDSFFYKGIDFDWLVPLHEVSVKHLTNPASIDLLKNHHDLVNIYSLVKLTPSQGELVAPYLPSIKTQIVKMEDLHSLTDVQCKLMRLPFIVNAVNRQNIPFHVGKWLPPHVKPMLTNEFYQNWLQKNPENYDILANIPANRIKYLLDKFIMPLVSEGILLIEKMATYPTSFLELLRRKKLSQLITEKIITLTDFRKLSYDTIELIDAHPLLKAWLSLKIIKIEDVKPDNLTALYSEVYAKRLVQLTIGKPYKILGMNDSIDLISEEITVASKHAEVSEDHLQKAIRKNYFKQMVTLLNQYCNSSYTHEKDKAQFQQLRIICRRGAAKTADQNALEQLILTARNILNDYAFIKAEATMTHYHLFAATHLSLHKLCTNIKNLATLIHEYSNENVASVSSSVKMGSERR